MIQNCPRNAGCPPDSPLANFSAEIPDQILFFSIAFSSTPPRLGNTFTATGCNAICESAISQADADQCAARLALECGIDKGGNPPPTVYCNLPQTITVLCPDGLPFTWSVPAGLFCASSQIDADLQAKQYAAVLARGKIICLGPITDFVCKGSQYSSQISITGGIPPFTWDIPAGVPPQGIDLDAATGKLFGTVMGAGGPYQFTVRVTDAAGSHQQKDYLINVMSIDSASFLPSSAVNTPYIYNILNSGGVGALSFQIVSGALPAGLTLNEQTGVISGTPTQNGTFAFTVKLQDQAT